MDSIIHFSLENSKPEVIQKYKTTKDNHSLPYFLWRLEFAKVFVEKGGFDIVIGNPPYVDSENMVKYSPEFRAICNKNYLSAKGNWDLFVLFVELGYLISNSNANVSFIIPNKIIAADYAKSVRANIVAMTGYDGGKLKGLAGFNLHVPIDNMQISEDVHLIFNHLITYILNCSNKGVSYDCE